jgi:hypothetical protein
VLIERHRPHADQGTDRASLHTISIYGDLTGPDDRAFASTYEAQRHYTVS